MKVGITCTTIVKSAVGLLRFFDQKVTNEIPVVLCLLLLHAETTGPIGKKFETEMAHKKTWAEPPAKRAMKLYKLDVSPPARACMMACELFEIDVEMVDVNIMRQEHRTPDYLQLNPLHTVPVLEDEGVVINDSHAILMYLADVYNKDESLYPKDPKKRALVNQKLFFETSILFPNVRRTIYSAMVDSQSKLSEKQKNEIGEAYGFVEEFLSRSEYLAGDNISIADISAITSVTTLDYIIPIDRRRYPKTVAWIKKIEGKPFYKINIPGLKTSGEWIKSIIEL